MPNSLAQQGFVVSRNPLINRAFVAGWVASAGLAGDPPETALDDLVAYCAADEYRPLLAAVRFYQRRLELTGRFSAR